MKVFPLLSLTHSKVVRCKLRTGRSLRTFREPQSRKICVKVKFNNLVIL